MNIENAIAYFKANIDGNDEPDLKLDQDDLPVCMKYTNDFSIFFLSDIGEYFEMVQVKHIKEAKLDEKSLLEIGKRNLGLIANDVEITKNEGLLYFSGNGNFEASLMLVPEIWDKWLVEYCPNGYIAAVPARDILVVSDSKNMEGIQELLSIVDRVWPERDHLLSKSLFHYDGDTWRPYQNA